MDYACVQWECEGTYSSVLVKHIDFDRLQILDVQELIEMTLNVTFEKNKLPAAAKIIGIGSRAKMSQMCADESEKRGEISFDQSAVSQNSQKQKRRKVSLDLPPDFVDPFQIGKSASMKSSSALKQKNKHISQSTMEVIRQLNVIPNKNGSTAGNVQMETNNIQNMAEDVLDHTQENGSSQDEMGDLAELSSSVRDSSLNFGNTSTANSDFFADNNGDCTACDQKDETIRKLRGQLETMQKKNRKFHTSSQDNFSEAEDGTLVDIGRNVMVKKSVVLDIRSEHKYNPAKFLRALMEKTGLWTIQQIAECSVYGKKSSQNQTDFREALDPTKFNACVEYTIRKCKLQVVPKKCATFEPA